MTSADYSILSAPRISLATFSAVLREAGSPAAPYADRAYAAAVDWGVDPAVLLAVFRKESTYGLAGVATRSKSWGNLRRSPYYPSRDGFVYYPSWSAGAWDCARLLDVYGRNLIRPGTRTDSAQTFPYVWAPTADGNAPDSYGDQIVAYVTAFIRRDGGKPAPSPAPTPAPRPKRPADATHWLQVKAGTRLRRFRLVDREGRPPLVVEADPFVTPNGFSAWGRKIAGRNRANRVVTVYLIRTGAYRGRAVWVANPGIRATEAD